MKAIFQREFKAILRSRGGISFVAIHLFFSGLLFTIFNLLYAYPRAEIVFSFLAIPIAVLIPIIGCTAFTSDRKNKTDVLLDMLPISKKDVLFGKHLARLAVVAIPTAVMMLYPVILDIYGDVNYAGTYLILFVFFLFEAFILSLSVMLSAVSKNSLGSFLITYGILVVTYIIPYIPVWLSKIVSDTASTTLSEICLFLTPFGQMDFFTVGIFDFRKVIWFLSFTAMTMVISYFKLCRKAEQI